MLLNRLLLTCLLGYLAFPGLAQPAEDLVALVNPLMENGHRFAVRALGNGPDTPYIQRAWLNGQPFNRTWLSHAEIMQGGELRLEMGPAPQKAWASGAEAAPYSMSGE